MYPPAWENEVLTNHRTGRGAPPCANTDGQGVGWREWVPALAAEAQEHLMGQKGRRLWKWAGLENFPA